MGSLEVTMSKKEAIDAWLLRTVPDSELRYVLSNLFGEYAIGNRDSTELLIINDGDSVKVFSRVKISEGSNG